MQKYLALKQMHQDGDAPEVQKKILYCFRIVSRLFADPVKAEEGFQFPDQLKDINIWKILTNLVDPNTGSPQARILRENAPEEGVDDSLLQLMVSSAAALGGAAAAVDMDAGLAEDADADLGGDEGVVIDNDDDGSEADDEVEGDLGDDNNDDDGGGHVEIRRITYDLNVAISHVDPLGQPNAGALHQLVLTELSLHPLPGIDVPDGGYGVTYVLQAGNEQQRVDLQGLQNVQNPPWINLAGFIVSVEARDLFLPKFIPVSMDTPHGDAQPMGTFDIRGCEDAIDLMLDVAVLVNPIVVGYNTDYWVNLPNYPDSILNHDDIVEAYWPLVVQGLFRVVVVLPVNDDHDDPPSGESVVED
ncbi:hypothetical protein C1H46_039705 [Malus baccata]|uniref:Uncharacterized protein n=1 Tax=Malus baccata TaxID=106549 RepID=A0A540KKL6_MALBA|nr:hypothetical protein C1H46_039705 [Malus baccata]